MFRCVRFFAFIRWFFRVLAGLDKGLFFARGGFDFFGFEFFEAFAEQRPVDADRVGPHVLTLPAWAAADRDVPFADALHGFERLLDFGRGCVEADRLRPGFFALGFEQQAKAALVRGPSTCA